MCGIAGLIDIHGRLDEPVAVLRKMGQAIAHRGPDGSGEWFDVTARVGLAHRRLAIIDLSDEGAQPMASACGRYVVVFNGEIYNFRELRAELERLGVAPPWRGHSDTEVVLAAVAHWGLEGSLRRFNGMFAMAMYDKEQRVLHLARDRFGEKPCYYGWHGGCFVFGSELKALESLPVWRGVVDPEATSLLLRFCYVPAPFSIYAGIRKLPPASFISVAVGSLGPELPEPREFWSAIDAMIEANSARAPASDGEVVDATDAALRRAVALRMHADVPLGAFLSGGVDSSLVVALMQAQSSRPVRTFSIGVQDAYFDESGHARRVASHLGTQHTEFSVTPETMMDVVPLLSHVYDEPFADSSQIPTIMVARMASQHVKVALSGDGGDELFGGYSRHVWAGRLQRVLGLPRPLREAASRLLSMPPAEYWDWLAVTSARLAGRSPTRILGHKVHKVARVMRASGREELYRALVTFWDEPWMVAAAGAGRGSDVPGVARGAGRMSFAEQMMLQDTVTYLPDDILVKVDRATMAASLEGRVPFLDPDVLALAWRSPESARVRGRQGKWVLRQLLYRYVPRALVDRPKAGFALPIGAWLRGPLRDWAEQYLGEDALRSSGYFDPKAVRRVWQEHLRGGGGAEHKLWAVLMLQMWHRDRLGRIP